MTYLLSKMSRRYLKPHIAQDLLNIEYKMVFDQLAIQWRAFWSRHSLLATTDSSTSISYPSVDRKTKCSKIGQKSLRLLRLSEVIDVARYHFHLGVFLTKSVTSTRRSSR